MSQDGIAELFTQLFLNKLHKRVEGIRRRTQELQGAVPQDVVQSLLHWIEEAQAIIAGEREALVDATRRDVAMSEGREITPEDGTAMPVKHQIGDGLLFQVNIFEMRLHDLYTRMRELSPYLAGTSLPRRSA